ncbi:MAG: hypothetical protein HYX69_07370 [Planctomycetia bacterium]|nr:hypothetical protein [Planctomycetia bacterium]
MARMLSSAAASCAVLAALAGPGLLSAQAPPSDEFRVARLVRELGADSFAVRKTATEELARLGPAARRAVEEATHNDDPEVRLRAKDLLLAIKVHDLWAPGRFARPDAPVAASQILRLLGEQTGNHLLVGDQFGTFHDSEVKLESASNEYWAVLDDVCRQSGNHCRPHYDSRTPGVVVVAGAPGRQPLAYAGPVRGRITTARRMFVEELNYEDARSDKTHTFQLNLEMTWEDRFKLVAYRSQPEVVDAVTDSGERLSSAQASAGGWNVAGAGTRQLTMNLRLQPPPAAATRLDVLKLTWGLIAVGDMATLAIDDTASQDPHFQDDVELVVESFQATSGGRYETTVRVTRDLVLPEPQEILFQEHELELVDAEGKPLRKLGQTNTLADHGATLKATFATESEMATPRQLRFIYPRLRSQRDLAITFRDVPLPTGRPE